MTDDARTPLLDAWGEFVRQCLPDHDPRILTDQMLSFFAGAGTVVGLIRSAAAQGGDDEASVAFAVLSEETDAFADLISSARPRSARSESKTH